MPMLTPAQAETLIEQHLVCLPIESLPLTQAAGAVLRENIYAERDQPLVGLGPQDGDGGGQAAHGVQAARAGAKQGDIFTPEMRPVFRKLLAPATFAKARVTAASNKGASRTTNEDSGWWPGVACKPALSRMRRASPTAGPYAAKRRSGIQSKERVRRLDSGFASFARAPRLRR